MGHCGHSVAHLGQEPNVNSYSLASERPLVEIIACLQTHLQHRAQLAAVHDMLTTVRQLSDAAVHCFNATVKNTRESTISKWDPDAAELATQPVKVGARTDPQIEP